MSVVIPYIKERLCLSSSAVQIGHLQNIRYALRYSSNLRPTILSGLSLSLLHSFAWQIRPSSFSPEHSWQAMVRFIYSTVVAIVVSYVKCTTLPTDWSRPLLRFVNHSESCARRGNELVFCTQRHHQCNRYNLICTDRTDLDYGQRELELAGGPWQPCDNRKNALSYPNVCLFNYSCMCFNYNCTCQPPDAVDPEICKEPHQCGEDEYCGYYYNVNTLQYAYISKWYNQAGGRYQDCHQNDTCDGDLKCTQVSRFYHLCA